MADVSAEVLRARYLQGSGTTGDVLSLLGPALPEIGAVFSRGSNLSIVLTVAADSQTLHRFASSLSSAMPAFHGELHLQANADVTDDEIERFAALLNNAAVHATRDAGTKLGAADVNRILMQCQGEWVLFIHPRASITAGFLLALLSELSRSGAHFCVIPACDESEQTSWLTAMPEVRDDGQLLLHAERIGKDNASWVHSLPVPDDIGFIARKATLLGVDGFHAADGGFSAYLELATRIFHAGLKIAVCSESVPIDVAEKPVSAVLAPVGRKIHHYHDTHTEWLRPYGLEALVNAEDLKVIHADKAGRPKIALVIDVDFWAFGNIARQISRYLSDRYEFMVIPIGVVSNINHVLMLAQDCALIHFFWREDVRTIGTPYFYSYAQGMGFRDRDFNQRFLHGKVITTSVYDHLMLEPEDVALRLPMYTQQVAGYTVASEKLYDIYAALPGYPKPTVVTEDGVDLSLFRPVNMERFDSIGCRQIVVGWVGNSKWEATREDFKGLHTLLVPALAALRAEGLPIAEFFADRQVRFIPHHEMPAYYGKIDIYVCASKIEGTPNPVLEAMACGVPVISTDVGIVPQVFGPKQKQFILPERSADALREKLREIIANPGLLRELSDENLCSIQEWSWEVKAEKFGRFFDAMLSGGKDRHG